MNNDAVSGISTFARTNLSGSRGVVLVVHEAPAYRRGVAVGLVGAGFSVREASSFFDADEDCDIRLLAVKSAQDHEALSAARESITPTVALLPSPRPTDYQMALRCGAAGAVAQDATVQQILNVIDAALRREALIPLEIARALAAGCAPEPEAVGISDQVAEWLGALSEGVPISTIARHAGYSERQMYRRMQQLYRRLGARNRGEAIYIAARWGIVPER